MIWLPVVNSADHTITQAAIINICDKNAGAKSEIINGVTAKRGRALLLLPIVVNLYYFFLIKLYLCTLSSCLAAR